MEVAGHSLGFWGQSAVDGDGLLWAVGGTDAGLFVERGVGLGGDHDAVALVVGLEHLGRERVAATVTGARSGVDSNPHERNHCTFGAMEPEFGGRIALVTGAAGRGIGQATARRLAAGGARVVVTDIHERRTSEVTEAIAADFPDTTIVGYPLDAGDRAQIDEVVAEVARTLGPVQILVNNAAINVQGSIFDYDPDDWDWVMRVNLSGAWYLCRATMPLMRDAGGGVIVNVSTYAPDVGGAGVEAPYAVSKGGLNVLTRSCAHEGGPHNIRAVTVAMGAVKGTKFAEDHAEMFERADTTGPLGTFPDATDIAEAIAFLASDRAANITGETLNVAAGAYMRT